MSGSPMRSFLSRISSRKFLTTLAVEVAALIVLFAPAHERAVVSAAEHIAAIAAMVLAALGYVNAETRLDQGGREDSSIRQ